MDGDYALGLLDGPHSLLLADRPGDGLAGRSSGRDWLQGHERAEAQHHFHTPARGPAGPFLPPHSKLAVVLVDPSHCLPHCFLVNQSLLVPLFISLDTLKHAQIHPQVHPVPSPLAPFSQLPHLLLQPMHFHCLVTLDCPMHCLSYLKQHHIITMMQVLIEDEEQVLVVAKLEEEMRGVGGGQRWGVQIQVLHAAGDYDYRNGAKQTGIGLLQVRKKEYHLMENTRRLGFIMKINSAFDDGRKAAVYLSCKTKNPTSRHPSAPHRMSLLSECCSFALPQNLSYHHHRLHWLWLIPLYFQVYSASAVVIC